MILPLLSELFARIGRHPAVAAGLEAARVKQGRGRLAGLTDPAKALVVAHAAATLGRPVLLLVESNDRADRLSGPLRYFLDVLVPLSRTNIAALFVIEFIFMWSKYLWPRIVTNTADMRVVQIGLKMLIATDAISPAWNVIMAGTIGAMLPPLVVLIVFRKSFAEGIAMQTAK